MVTCKWRKRLPLRSHQSKFAVQRVRLSLLARIDKLNRAFTPKANFVTCSPEFACASSRTLLAGVICASLIKQIYSRECRRRGFSWTPKFLYGNLFSTMATTSLYLFRKYQRGQRTQRGRLRIIISSGGAHSFWLRFIRFLEHSGRSPGVQLRGSLTSDAKSDRAIVGVGSGSNNGVAV